MTVEILPSAREDLVDGFDFYEQKEPGVGAYFVNSLMLDIESLSSYGGIHRKRLGIIVSFHIAFRTPFTTAWNQTQFW